MIFKKKQKPLGYFALIEWSDMAKERSLGYDFMKKIVHYNNGYVVGIENYTTPKIRQLRRDNIFVKDLTRGQMIPKESRFIPHTWSIMGRLQLIKRV